MFLFLRFESAGAETNNKLLSFDNNTLFYVLCILWYEQRVHAVNDIVFTRRRPTRAVLMTVAVKATSCRLGGRR